MPSAAVKNYYRVLGVQPSASGTNIKRAFRKLAKRYHPDRNPGNALAEEQFKRVQEAYSVLGDADKRLAYDRKLRLADQASRQTTTPRGTRYRQRPDGTYERQTKKERPASRGSWWLSWLFGDPATMRRIRLTLPFQRAFRGGPVTIPVPREGPVRVTLPEGVKSGYSIRIRDVNGPPLQVTFEVATHKAFRMDGNDLILKVPLKVPVIKAVLGGSCQVAHPSGKPITVRIPAGMQPGTTLRVPNKGAAGGDMVAPVKITIPESLTATQRRILRQAAESAGLL